MGIILKEKGDENATMSSYKQAFKTKTDDAEAYTEMEGAL